MDRRGAPKPRVLIGMKAVLLYLLNLALIACAWSVTLLVSVGTCRKWIGRFGWDEFSGYLFHDRWQRMGTIGRNLNAFLLRQARK